MTEIKGKISSESLKKIIYRELREGGFKFKKDSLIPPNLNDKDALRKAHLASKKHLLLKNKSWIINNEADCLKYFAEGDDISPDDIYPELVLVDDPEKAMLFRYASYLWSVPLSNGFGRRFRYLVMDKSNGKLIGIFGLTDPVIGLSVRDDWIGWGKTQKEKMLWHVMDLYAFGAVKPYSFLLGGKLVATLATSSEVRKEFLRKYATGRTKINGKNYKSRKGGLVLLTTTGAFGESSILDRLNTVDNRTLWDFIGFTQGWGSFHLNNGIASQLYDYLVATNNPLVKKNRFGDGPNWKLRIIREGLQEFGLDYSKYCRHGIKRGFYAAPLATNFKEFLNGQVKKPKHISQNVNDLFEFFQERYLLPRAQRDPRWKEVTKDEFQLSNQI